MTKLDRRLTPARSDLAAERLRGIVEAARYVAGEPRRIAVTACPLRAKPEAGGPLDTEAVFGEPVTVFDERDGFAWVQLETDGYVGYVPAEAIGPRGAEPTHRVAALRTFVQPEPALKLTPSGYLGFGALVAPTGEERDGYVALATGGFVVACHLEPVGTRSPDRVAVAERFVGTPYLWGGKTSLGLDCSGLVQVALAAGGIAAPRDSDLQAAGLGRPFEPGPDLGGLRRGDLVFWRGHVGIMLDAASLLHANAHHMAVAIEPLAEAERRIRAKEHGPITGVRRL